MADNLSKEKRSKIMASIRGKDTRPEIMIRRILWSSGKRYRLHDRSVFGLPDISSKSKKVAVFIDGCFWHGCKTCYKEPSTNVQYWRNKIVKNAERRKAVVEKLASENWTIMEFWEHEVILGPQAVASKVAKFL